ncbi:MAG TPA: hypothetical protein VFE91_05435, partial [Nitrososphaerales archaeon]|nr:hypothetical protein [Nitrososphaerales archaeon]
MKNARPKISHGHKFEDIVLRPLTMKDLGAALTFANSIVKDRSGNDDLGLISFDEKMTKKTETEFLRRVVEGTKKKNVVSVAAFDRGVMVGNC